MSKSSDTKIPTLTEYLKDESSAIKLLTKNRTTVPSLIASLHAQFSLENDVFIRKNAANYLLSAIKKATKNQFENSPEKVSEIVNFLLLKIINDSHLLWGEILESLYFIFSKMEKLVHVDHYSEVMKTVLENVHAQSLSKRLYLFKLILILIKHHPCTAKKLGSNFIEKYIEFADEEKDPETLKVIWNLTILINKINVNPGPLLPDFWEICSMYWPIEFKSSPDKAVNNKQSMKLQLDEVLTSTPLFIVENYSAILDKLSSDGFSAKICALDLFIKMCEKYPEQAYKNRNSEDSIESAIFSSIKMLLIDHSDKEFESVKEATLECLTKCMIIFEDRFNLEFLKNLLKNEVVGLKKIDEGLVGEILVAAGKADFGMVIGVIERCENLRIFFGVTSFF